MHAYLIGGGRDSAAAHRPFARAVAGPGPVVILLLDEPDAEPDRWVAALAAVGIDRTEVVTVSDARPPNVGDVSGASGLYVAGGLTPGYRDALVGHGTDWLEAIRAAGVPYAGFSAGSAVAAEQALVGGYRVDVDGRTVEVASEDASEDLDLLTVRPGLGLVPFLVDVHAAQWGTLHRLVYAVLDQGSPGVGWAIDEGTVLHVEDGAPVAVHGTGAATRVRRTDRGAEVSIHLAGAVLSG